MKKKTKAKSKDIGKKAKKLVSRDSTSFKIAEFIATFAYVGKFKYAPGTVASIISVLILFFSFNTFEGQVTQAGLSGLILFILFFFFIGIWAAEIYRLGVNKVDPKEVVIDEVVGYAFTVLLSMPLAFALFVTSGLAGENFYGSALLFFLIIPFILFRIFDIMKPWPISKIDRDLVNGFGIMLDDMVAAFMASLTYFAIFYLLASFEIYVL